MQPKEILSTRNSKQTKPHSCPETSSREVMCLRRKKKGKSKVQSRIFYLRDSETEQRALRFLHINCSNASSYSSAPELNRPNPRDRTLDLPFFSRPKQVTSLKSLPLPAQSESLPYWLQGTFATSFLLNF